MTQEEYTTAVSRLISDWETAGLKPATLLWTEHNATVIGMEIGNFCRNGGYLPDVKTLTTIVRSLGNIESGGRLQYHTVVAVPAVPVAQAPDPRLSIPHRDLFPQITDIESGIKYVQTRKGIPAGMLPALNETLAYVQVNNIRTPKVDESTTLAEPPALTELRGRIAAMRQRVDELKMGDVGSWRSDAKGGKFVQLQNAKDRMHAFINTWVRQRYSADEIDRMLDSEIDALSSRSIK